MKKLLILLFSLSFLGSPSVFADEIDDMLFEMTSDLNSSLPMRVDSLTTWDSSIYLKSENLFTYLYTLDNYDRRSDYDASVLNDFFNNVITKFCTDPETRFLLGLTDVSMKYFNLNGEYLFKNEFSENQC
jgi:hypothetical protein